MENISTEAKQAETQLSNAMHMHLEDDLNQVEKTGRVNTPSELVHNLIPPFMLLTHFILMTFTVRHPLYKYKKVMF
jgi:hypothetical protein